VTTAGKLKSSHLQPYWKLSESLSSKSSESPSTTTCQRRSMCTMWSRRVPRHCTLWKFCVHMGWMTQPSNMSTRQSSSPSWCMAHLHGGALRVPAIDSEFRRSSITASVAGSLHQIYRSSPTCAVKPMRICLTASSTTVTMSYIIFFLHRHRCNNTTLCDPGDTTCNFL